jgi:GNAT superfamily N-acetyltransferase
MGEFIIEPVSALRSELCRAILGELPEWFGIPEAIDHYAAFAEHADMLGAVADGIVGGFVCLRTTSEVACEIYVMAVRPAFHRRGLGTALVHAASEWARNSGRRYLTVKTVGPSRENAAYAGTRRFYAAAGFEPIEEFDELWDGIPCLLLLKPLSSGGKPCRPSPAISC